MDDDSGGSGDEAGGGSYFTRWSTRMERKDGSWNARRPADVQDYVKGFTGLALRREERREAESRALQAAVDEKSTQLRAIFRCSCVLQVELRQSSRRIVYHHLRGAAFLDLPVLSCPGCKTEATVKPYMVGCCPGTPAKPKAWLDIDLVEDYREIHFDGGSADGMAQLAVQLCVCVCVCVCVLCVCVCARALACCGLLKPPSLAACCSLLQAEGAPAHHVRPQVRRGQREWARVPAHAPARHNRRCRH